VPSAKWTLATFEATLTRSGPPPEIHPLLQALWHERHGDWTRAHEITQDIDSGDASWVHAYLHRREGDLANARYWYTHAGKRPETGRLDKEWRTIVETLLTA
jgi:hypothetical protein